MNHYCGPFALSFLLGIGTDEAARRIRAMRRRKGVKCYRVRGVYPPELRNCIHGGGYDVGAINSNENAPTLARWLKTYKDERKKHTFVVVLTGHFIVVKGRKIYDNRYPDGVFLKRFKGRRKRVRAFFWVEKRF